MFRKYLYKECRECGTPRIIRMMYKWGSDGTMGIKFREIRRMVIINASLYDDLVEEVNRKLGIPVWHIVFESVRNSGRISMEDLFHSDFLLGKMKKYLWARRLIIHFFHELSALMGYCYSETVEPARENVRSAYIKNPFNLHCVAGAIVSAFEALDGFPFGYDWDRIGGDEYIISIKPIEEKPEISRRLDQIPQTVIEGKLNLERCPACGAPRRISELFEWRLDEGILTHKKSKDRFCAFVSTTLPPIFDEISRELETDMSGFLVDTQCEWTIAHLSRLGVTSIDSILNSREAKLAFREYLGDFPVYGYGNPVAFDIEEGFYSITIENPFYIEMIAGTLLGLYKGLFQKEAQIEWEAVEENKVTYVLRSG
ncbi:MAG: hypothetical protein JXA49_02305 [Actinobacteria bacterium]|nr:hypothetical protein [Actinomycetota bacterium]